MPLIVLCQEMDFQKKSHIGAQLTRIYRKYQISTRPRQSLTNQGAADLSGSSNAALFC